MKPSTSPKKRPGVSNDGSSDNDRAENQRRIRELPKNNGRTVHAQASGFRPEKLPKNDQTEEIRLVEKPS
jgi:hypothetical protein